MKEFDFSSISIKNLKYYLYNVLDGTDMFKIKLNDEEFEIPIELATCYSNKICENLTIDPTTRQLDIHIQFNNQNIIQKIIPVLTDRNQINTKLEIENETELMDLLLFGKEIGYDPILSLLNDYISLRVQTLKKENAIELLSFCQSFGHLENVEQNIISFISSHLYEFIIEPQFIDWSCDQTNFSYLESILSNDNLHLKREDDLLQYIIEISTRNKHNEIFFGKVYLEYCDVSTITQFVQYLENQKNEFQDITMRNILICISRRLYQGHKSNIDTKRFINNAPNISISSNSGETIPEKSISQRLYQVQKSNIDTKRLFVS